jgi:hypothetical protein
VDQWGRDFPLREKERERSPGDDSAKVSAVAMSQAPAGQVSSAPGRGVESTTTQRTRPWTETEQQVLYFAQIYVRRKGRLGRRRAIVFFLVVYFVIFGVATACFLKDGMSRYHITPISLMSAKEFWLGLFSSCAYFLAIGVGCDLAVSCLRSPMSKYQRYRLLVDLADESTEAKRVEIRTEAAADRVDTEQILQYARNRLAKGRNQPYLSRAMRTVIGVIIIAAVLSWTAQGLINGIIRPEQAKWMQYLETRKAYTLGLGAGALLSFWCGILFAGLKEFRDGGIERQVARLLLRFAGRSQYVPPD